MTYQQYIVSDTNPNDVHGGGGCVCDPRKQIDCKPPYVVLYGNDMVDDRSPHVVICASCAAAFARAVQGEALSAGETGTVVEAPQNEELPSRPEPPVVESPDPARDFPREKPAI